MQKLRFLTFPVLIVKSCHVRKNARDSKDKLEGQLLLWLVLLVKELDVVDNPNQQYQVPDQHAVEASYFRFHSFELRTEFKLSFEVDFHDDPWTLSRFLKFLSYTFKS